MPETPDIFTAANPVFTRVRVERTIKYVSRQTLDEYKALGGESLEKNGIDPDSTVGDAHAAIVQQWAGDPYNKGILGYLAQWGFMDGEIAVIHHIKVYVDAKLAWEGDLVE